MVLRAENAMLSFANFVEQMSPINVIIMREQLNVKQRQSISETPAKGGGGLFETCFSSLKTGDRQDDHLRTLNR